MAEMLGSMKADITVLLQKTKEIFSLHKVQLARLHGRTRQFVRAADNGGAQAQYFSGLHHPQNKRPTLIGGRELCLPLAQDKDAPGRLAFKENHRACGVRTRVLYALKCFQRGSRESAEKFIGAQPAEKAILCKGQTVGRVHTPPPAEDDRNYITFVDGQSDLGD